MTAAGTSTTGAAAGASWSATASAADPTSDSASDTAERPTVAPHESASPLPSPPAPVTSLAPLTPLGGLDLPGLDDAPACGPDGC